MDHLAEWKLEFRQVAHRLALSGRPFTSEDIVDVVGLPSGEHEQNKNNAVGTMMMTLHREKAIKKTGKKARQRSRVSHSTTTVWVGASSKPQAIGRKRQCPVCGR